MARTTEPMFVNKFGGTHTTFSSTGQQIVVQEDVSESQIVRVLSLVNKSLSDDTLYMYINDGSSIIQVAVLAVPASAGELASVPAFDVLSSENVSSITEIDDSGNKYITLPSGWSILFDFANVSSDIMVHTRTEVLGG